MKSIYGARRAFSLRGSRIHLKKELKISFQMYTLNFPASPLRREGNSKSCRDYYRLTLNCIWKLMMKWGLREVKG